uniref:Uncharacterized protein n=1 Tax=Timema bartmani TaxID=61472 RepID=A0A7R9I3T0_9NEOP|nr:unnamed protein product [Timema bartmani]
MAVFYGKGRCCKDGASCRNLTRTPSWLLEVRLWEIQGGSLVATLVVRCRQLTGTTTPGVHHTVISRTSVSTSKVQTELGDVTDQRRRMWEKTLLALLIATSRAVPQLTNNNLQQLVNYRSSLPFQTALRGLPQSTSPPQTSYLPQLYRGILASAQPLILSNFDSQLDPSFQGRIFNNAREQQFVLGPDNYINNQQLTLLRDIQQDTKQHNFPDSYNSNNFLSDQTIENQTRNSFPQQSIPNERQSDNSLINNNNIPLEAFDETRFRDSNGRFQQGRPFQKYHKSGPRSQFTGEPSVQEIFGKGRVYSEQTGAARRLNELTLNPQQFGREQDVQVRLTPQDEGRFVGVDRRVNPALNFVITQFDSQEQSQPQRRINEYAGNLPGEFYNDAQNQVVPDVLGSMATSLGEAGAQQQVYSVNFEGAGFGYGYMVRGGRELNQQNYQSLSTLSPPAQHG